MECRGVVSVYDPRADAVTIWSSTQVVHWVRREVASLLGLPEARVRCVALDVGGGFGGKGHVYPEDLLIPMLARLAGRPVRWIEERQEHLLSACHARDQVHDVVSVLEDVDDTDRPERAGVERLPAGGRIEKRAVQPQGVTSAARFCAHDGSFEPVSVGVGVVETLGHL